MKRLHFTICVPDAVWRVLLRILLFYRRVRYGYAFRHIRLTQGQKAIVDVEDYEWLSRVKWFADKSERSYYAARMVYGVFGRKKVWMHREIQPVRIGKFVDHINGNGLDNRKCNLRPATREQNAWNMRKQQRKCSSRYKGVSWLKEQGKWRVRILYKGTRIPLGCFDDEAAAARAYDSKAKELFGEYAKPNF